MNLPCQIRRRLNDGRSNTKLVRGSSEQIQCLVDRRGARTTEDGAGVLLFVVGGRPFDPDDPCSVRYSAVVEETDRSVSVGFTSERPRGAAGCDAIGFVRTMEIALDGPLGERPLHVLGDTRPVFDGTTLVDPTWIPDGWQFLVESPGYPDPEEGQYWSRWWGFPAPPETGTTCTPSVTPLELTEGAADLVDRFPLEMGETTVGEFDINGSVAVYSTQPDHGVARLAWTANGRGFVLRTSTRCLGDPPPPVETMLRFATSLTSP